MPSSRRFIKADGIGINTHLLKVRSRMEYLSMCVVRQRGVIDEKGKLLGWVLNTTDIPLSSHGKHFLRQHGWPIPGDPTKCNLFYCQERNNNPIRRETHDGV
jgi:hypothetical protein